MCVCVCVRVCVCVCVSVCVCVLQYLCQCFGTCCVVCCKISVDVLVLVASCVARFLSRFWYLLLRVLQEFCLRRVLHDFCRCFGTCCVVCCKISDDVLVLVASCMWLCPLNYFKFVTLSGILGFRMTTCFVYACNTCTSCITYTCTLTPCILGYKMVVFNPFSNVSFFQVLSFFLCSLLREHLSTFYIHLHIAILIESNKLPSNVNVGQFI